MRPFLAGLALGTAIFCASCASPPSSDRSLGPPGSSLVGGRICFEQRAADGGWHRVALVNAEGKPPIRGTVARGEWYLPADGRARVLPNCPEESDK